MRAFEAFDSLADSIYAVRRMSRIESERIQLLEDILRELVEVVDPATGERSNATGLPEIVAKARSLGLIDEVIKQMEEDAEKEETPPRTPQTGSLQPPSQ